MKPVTELVRVVHGSHLYGTSTPQSDRDYKAVHIPSGEAILLGRPENVLDLGTVAKDANGKNLPEAIDCQSFSVQKFFEMLMKGDTVATEILFAPYDECNPMWPAIRGVGRRLLNRQCKGFVGYCVRQAAKYGIKGSRMGTVKALLDFLEFHKGATQRLGVLEGPLRVWSESREHVKWENIPHPNGADCWHIDVCDRKVPMTLAIDEAYKIYKRVWDNYGARARQAMTNEGIDWKAVSHAMRVAGQAQELLLTGKITFPRPDADYLLDIKQGKIPYSNVNHALEEAVSYVYRCVGRSQLPEQSDVALAERCVLNIYKEQIR